MLPTQVLSPAEVDLARANFAEFDVDGDGLISHQDFVTAMSRHDSSWTMPNRRAQLDAMCAPPHPFLGYLVTCPARECRPRAARNTHTTRERDVRCGRPHATPYLVTLTTPCVPA